MLSLNTTIKFLYADKLFQALLNKKTILILNY